MKFDVVTIFPHMFENVFKKGVVGQAIENKTLSLNVHNLRDYTTDKHRSVDEIPYGGGGGLVFKVEPLVAALRDIQDSFVKSRSILMSPRGRKITPKVAEELSKYEQLILFCGRYEGVDERFLDYVDEELSIGDFVLTGGELPAMITVDIVSRFVPDVVGQKSAPYEDSFSKNSLEHPYYTRPELFEGKKVPEVLLSGHHEKIDAWRKQASLECTLQRRPDLLQGGSYDKENIK